MQGQDLILRLSALDLYLCRMLNRAGSRLLVATLSVVSRLGDGPIWYGLLLYLPLRYGTGDLVVAAQMVAVGVPGLLLYKAIKRRIARPRPYQAHGRIVLLGLPLDRYSFPSGHTLHAVAFTIVAAVHHPELAWGLVPFCLLVAASRVVLGLHYPSDVAAGAGIGAGLAAASLGLF